MDSIDALITLENRILLLTKNYLAKEGWLNDQPVDSQGFTPWFTYPAIAYLRDIIDSSRRVFEFGSGYSSLFFATHAGSCHSVEHNADWANMLLTMNQNVNVEIVPEGDAAMEAAAPMLREFEQMGFNLPLSNDRGHNVYHGLLNAEFAGYASRICGRNKGYHDIVVVDGMARVLCGFLAAQMIRDDGVIILDNSDRWQYNALQSYLIDSGFGRIDFWGPGPLNNYAWCTSFFSRRFGILNYKVTRPAMSGDLGW